MTKCDPAKLRKQADECYEHAGKARNTIDQEAWVSLADDLIKLAACTEQVRRLREYGD